MYEFLVLEPMGKRNYRKEYLKYHASKRAIKERGMRNKARDIMVKRGKVKKGDGLEVDHVRPLSKGGTNGISNLKVVTRKVNRKKGNHGI